MTLSKFIYKYKEKLIDTLNLASNLLYLILINLFLYIYHSNQHYYPYNRTFYYNQFFGERLK